MNATPPQLRAALLVAASALFAPTAARAQSSGRFTARVELGATLPVSAPQSRDFGLGFAGRADVGVRIAGPLFVRATASYLRWPSSASNQAGDDRSAAATLLGGGLSVEPALSPRVRLRFEGDLAAALNGASGDARLAWGAGVGAWFGLGDNLDLGPIVRVGAIQPAASEETVNGGPGAAHFLQFALALALHDAPPAPAPEPAPVPMASAPVAPVAVAPQTLVTAPAAPIVTFGAPVAAPSPTVVGPQPVVGPVVVPVGTPSVVVDEEPRGRHHRHHRRHRNREGRSRRHRRH